MVYELSEVEARDELYPSTLSYLELLNALIAADPDAADQGRRWGSPFRAYSFGQSLWTLIRRCLSHPTQPQGLLDSSSSPVSLCLLVWELSSSSSDF